MSMPQEYVELGKVIVGGIAASGPLTKLIEVVSSAIGTLYKPVAIRKEADANAYKTERNEEAQAMAAIIKANADNEILNITEKRLIQQEARRTFTIQDIADRTVKYLPETITDKPIDEDWKTRFFTIAQDISSDDLKEVWAKVLAGEISKPGSVGLRTLDVLKNLSQYEATIFNKLAGMATSQGAILKYNDLNFSEFQIAYSDIMQLREAGLIDTNDRLAISYKRKYSIDNMPHKGIFQGYGKWVLYIGTTKEDLNLDSLAMTQAGSELFGISDVQFNKAYLDLLVSSLKDENRYIKIISREEFQLLNL